MAKDILVTEVLSEKMTKSGAQLIHRLDKLDSEVKSAFWLFYPDEKSWKLIIASPLVGKHGPREFYKRVVSSNKDASKNENIVSLNDVGVANIDHPIVQLMKFVIGTGENDVSEIRFSRNTINGTFIEDCLIYRSST
ncbi:MULTISPECIES: hypothetical protein [Colwellia]|uniref:Uncharacterized protein n=1 Tax=Colwellia marinimaniae TaxID=1513592 RepID=A0ABQ0MYN1_9GAMM|nr:MULTISPECIES: hypothetical protein [Colwellia]GAW97465.1 hypothetical protein MTCD1_03092 [Colwellia marinimaniae]